jgi:lysylphosphatidylglycerol synthetase-like protein (DUF2156 family)
MKYILVLGIGTVVIGLFLWVGVDYFFGDWVSSFFAKFVAAPIGFVISLFLFLIYDQIWPKQSEPEVNKQAHDEEKL